MKNNYITNEILIQRSRGNGPMTLQQPPFRWKGANSSKCKNLEDEKKPWNLPL